MQTFFTVRTDDAFNMTVEYEARVRGGIFDNIAGPSAVDLATAVEGLRVKLESMSGSTVTLVEA